MTADQAGDDGGVRHREVVGEILVEGDVDDVGAVSDEGGRERLDGGARPE